MSTTTQAPTQAERVLEHLQTGNTITSLSALAHFGIIQLPRRIYDLKAAGWPIQSRNCFVTNRYGQRVRVKEYWLGEV